MQIVADLKYDTHTERIEAIIPALTLWVVYKQYPTGKIERVAAFFSEERARTHAASIIGKGRDPALVGLETIDVMDRPPQDVRDK